MDDPESGTTVSPEGDEDVKAKPIPGPSSPASAPLATPEVDLEGDQISPAPEAAASVSPGTPTHATNPFRTGAAFMMGLLFSRHQRKAGLGPSAF